MHSLVYVILPKEVESIEAYVDELLSGSDDDTSKNNPSYDVLCSCSGSVARTRAFDTVDNSSRE